MMSHDISAMQLRSAPIAGFALLGMSAPLIVMMIVYHFRIKSVGDTLKQHNIAVIEASTSFWVGIYCIFLSAGLLVVFILFLVNIGQRLMGV